MQLTDNDNSSSRPKPGLLRQSEISCRNRAWGGVATTFELSGWVRLNAAAAATLQLSGPLSGQLNSRSPLRSQCLSVVCLPRCVLWLNDARLAYVGRIEDTFEVSTPFAYSNLHPPKRVARFGGSLFDIKIMTKL